MAHLFSIETQNGSDAAFQACELSLDYMTDFVINSIAESVWIRVVCELTGARWSMHDNATKLGFVAGMNITMDQREIDMITARMTERELESFQSAFHVALDYRRRDI